MLRGNTIGKEETRAGNLFASDIAESRGSDVKIGYAIDVKHLRGSRKSELGRGGWRIPVTLNPLKATTKTGCATNIGKNVVRTENWAADDTFRKLEILQENRDRRNKNWSATNNGEKRKIEIWPYNTPDPRNSFYPNFLKKKICTLINDTTNFQTLNPHQKPMFLIKHKINLSNLSPPFSLEKTSILHCLYSRHRDTTESIRLQDLRRSHTWRLWNLSLSLSLEIEGE